MLQEPVHQRDAGARLPGAGRHRHEHVAASFRERRLDCLDRLALIRPQPGIVEGLLGKAVVIGFEILGELSLRMSCGLNHSGKALEA